MALPTGPSYQPGHTPLLRNTAERRSHENSPAHDFTTDSVEHFNTNQPRFHDTEGRWPKSGMDVRPPWLHRDVPHTGHTPHHSDGHLTPHGQAWPRPPDSHFHGDFRRSPNPHYQSEQSNYRNTEQFQTPGYTDTQTYLPSQGGSLHNPPRWTDTLSGAFNEFQHQPPKPLMPTVEIKSVSAEKLFDAPGRNDRPSHIVIVLRGLPGAGKSHLAKIIRDKEVSCGGPAPRILALDSYFLNEVEKTEKDPETGKRVKRKVQEYEFDSELEPSYRNSLFRSFNKTLDEGFFPMVIVDAVHEKVCHFDRYWSAGKMKGFQVYIVELEESIDVCVERNIHNRTREEIKKLAAQWEITPPHFTRLDVTALLSDTNIDEVEMECSDDEKERKAANDDKKSEQDESSSSVASRWDDRSEEKLDKLDAVQSFRKRRRLSSTVEGEGLSPSEYIKMKQEEGKPRKKRVRWADLEAAKEEEKKREIGFVIGSEWRQVSEEEATRLLKGDNNKPVT